MSRAVSPPLSWGERAERIFKPPGVPLRVLVGFREEILPVLFAYWFVATVLYVVFGREWAFPVAVLQELPQPKMMKEAQTMKGLMMELPEAKRAMMMQMMQRIMPPDMLKMMM